MNLRLIFFSCFWTFSLQVPTRIGQKQCCKKTISSVKQNPIKAQSDQQVISKGPLNGDRRKLSGSKDAVVKPLGVTNIKRCPDSWLRFRESCYYMERKRMDMTEAEANCHQKGASLFVANTVEEFDLVMRSSLLNFWSWIGMVQFEFMNQPIWQSSGGIEPSKLKWLVSPYSSGLNGYTAASECVAYYNSELKIASYNYFYPCQLQFGSICERNASVISFSSNQ